MVRMLPETAFRVEGPAYTELGTDPGSAGIQTIMGRS